MQQTKSKNCGINKEDSSPSLSCVHCPKAEIFVEMFRTKLQSVVWSRHVAVLQHGDQ